MVDVVHGALDEVAARVAAGLCDGKALRAVMFY